MIILNVSTHLLVEEAFGRLHAKAKIILFGCVVVLVVLCRSDRAFWCLNLNYCWDDDVCS
jgi:hypothetical protein